MKPKDETMTPLALAALNKEAEASLQALTQELFVAPLLAPVNKILGGQKTLEGKVETMLSSLEEEEKKVRKEVRGFAEALKEQVAVQRNAIEKVEGFAEKLKDQAAAQEKSFEALGAQVLGGQQVLEGNVKVALASLEEAQKGFRQELVGVAEMLKDHAATQEQMFQGLETVVLAGQQALERKIEAAFSSADEEHKMVCRELKVFSETLKEQAVGQEKAFTAHEVGMLGKLAEAEGKLEITTTNVKEKQVQVNQTLNVILETLKGHEAVLGRTIVTFEAQAKSLCALKAESQARNEEKQATLHEATVGLRKKLTLWRGIAVSIGLLCLSMVLIAYHLRR